MPPDQEDEPQIDKKTDYVNCPNCGDSKAIKTTWAIGSVLFSSVNCPKCGYSKDFGSYQSLSKRN